MKERTRLSEGELAYIDVIMTDEGLSLAQALADLERMRTIGLGEQMEGPEKIFTWLEGEAQVEKIDEQFVDDLRRRSQYANGTFRWVEDKNISRFARQGYEVVRLPIASLRKRGERVFQKAGGTAILMYKERRTPRG